MMKITFVTGNKAKAKRVSYHLKHPLEQKDIDLIEIQSLDLEEIVEHKAKEAFRHLGTPVLVEDTSLKFNALGKLPGPLIKWFLKELDNNGLCKLLDSFSDKSALAEVSFGLYDGKTLHIFSGEMPGTIAKRAQGKSEFGWDPIFIPQGHTKTWGEMTEDEIGATSMRKTALEKLQKYLEQL